MKTTNAQDNGLAVRHVKIDGKRMVMLEESDYERLLSKADEWEPLLPEPNADGNYPALEYARVSLARKIIRDRRRLGLTQVELARRAAIRPETLNRIEHGKVSPTIATVEKIDRALQRAQRK
jgi:DNA-binding XRE family transcriptional regulator